MRKIKKTFKSPIKINGLKKLMKKVYENRSNHLAEIAKLNTGKSLVPFLVEKVEIEIGSLTGKETINVPNSSLTFLKGYSAPFTEINNNSTTEDQYIVLPWTVSRAEGREALKHLISKISLTTISLTYTIYIENAENLHHPTTPANQTSSEGGTIILSRRTNQPNTTSTTVTSTAIIPINAATKFPQPTSTAITTVAAATSSEERDLTESIEDLSWSANSFSEDNEDRLLSEIERLRKEIEDRDKKIAELKKISEDCKNQIEAWKKAESEKSWTVDLPRRYTGSYIRCGLFCRRRPYTENGKIVDWLPTLLEVKHKVAIDNIVGNLLCDFDNRILAINDGSFGTVRTE